MRKSRFHFFSFFCALFISAMLVVQPALSFAAGTTSDDESDAPQTLTINHGGICKQSPNLLGWHSGILPNSVIDYSLLSVGNFGATQALTAPTPATLFSNSRAPPNQNSCL